MNKIIAFFLLALTTVAACKKESPLATQNGTQSFKFPEKTAQSLEQYMKEQEQAGFSGTVLVMQKGQVLLRKGYGKANGSIDNTPETKFRIGSITKQFTAACILQLAEAGKLSVNDKLSKYFPDFPRGNEVTIHMLLNMTSGIKTYTDPSNFDISKGLEPVIEEIQTLSKEKDKMIAFIQKLGYEFSPGTKYSYSNSNYSLLGYIVEKVSGMLYTEYLQQNIFARIGMSNTGVSASGESLVSGAKGYGKGKLGLPPEILEKMFTPEIAFSAGNLYSTVDDLYKWDRALYGNAILNDASKHKMFTPGNGISGYGYGFGIYDVAKQYCIGHDGHIPGFNSSINRFVKGDICILVLSNNESDVSSITQSLASIVFDISVYQQPKEVIINTNVLNRYVGQYFSGVTGQMELIKKNNKLYGKVAGSELEFKPESETKFFMASSPSQGIEFEVDAAGKLVKAWVSNKGERGEELKKMQ